MFTSDTEGLDYLRWSQFDSPDEEGSGYKFMERTPVLLLDKYVRKTRYILDIQLAYTSPKYANQYILPSNSSHRVGLAVRIKILNQKKRMSLASFLINEGVRRIAFTKDYLYFDTDTLKAPMLEYWG